MSETLGKLQTVIASMKNGIELGDPIETLEWCEAEIRLLRAENAGLKADLRDTRWDRDAMTARHKHAQKAIKRLEQDLAAEKTVTDWQDREIKKEEIRLTEKMEEL